MLLFASDAGRMRVMEDPDESDAVTTILDLRLENEELCTNGERGLQTFAVHPDFDETPFVYVFYTSYREVRPGTKPQSKTKQKNDYEQL